MRQVGLGLNFHSLDVFSSIILASLLPAGTLLDYGVQTVAPFANHVFLSTVLGG